MFGSVHRGPRDGHPRLLVISNPARHRGLPPVAIFGVRSDAGAACAGPTDPGIPSCGSTRQDDRGQPGPGRAGAGPAHRRQCAGPEMRQALPDGAGVCKQRDRAPAPGARAAGTGAPASYVGMGDADTDSTDISIHSWNITKSTETMEGAFSGREHFIASGNVGHWDVSGVTSFS